MAWATRRRVSVFPSHRIAYADLAGQEHVRCTLVGMDGGRLKAIAFRAHGGPLGEILLDRGEGARVHVAGRLSINDWGGKREPAAHDRRRRARRLSTSTRRLANRFNPL